jgi:hypothetical protein
MKDKNKNKPQKIQMSSSYSWSLGIETSGVAGNCELLRLRKVTAMRRLKADHSLPVKTTKPKI